jgi:hypothetical protein
MSMKVHTVPFFFFFFFFFLVMESCLDPLGNPENYNMDSFTFLYM